MVSNLDVDFAVAPDGVQVPDAFDDCREALLDAGNLPITLVCKAFQRNVDALQAALNQCMVEFRLKPGSIGEELDDFSGATVSGIADHCRQIRVQCRFPMVADLDFLDFLIERLEIIDNFLEQVERHHAAF